jgi:hypothetical protein
MKLKEEKKRRERQRVRVDLKSMVEAFVNSELLYDPLELFFRHRPAFLNPLIQ